MLMISIGKNTKKIGYYQNIICIFAPNLKTKHKLL